MTGWLVLVAVLAAVLAGLAVYLIDRQLPARGRRVVVNLTDGTALRGILTSTPGPWLLLHDAELLRTDTGPPVRVDGSIYLERPRVLFVQVLP